VINTTSIPSQDKSISFNQALRKLEDFGISVVFIDALGLAFTLDQLQMTPEDAKEESMCFVEHILEGGR